MPIEYNASSDYKYTENKEEYEEVETADLMHLEPKLRDAWIKMRKLDKILVKVSKKERQVKKETVRLIEKNRAELEMLRLTTDHKETKMEAENTAHFLALSYVDLDDEIERDYPLSEGPTTPLFKTQLPDIDEDDARSENDESRKSTASSIDLDSNNKKPTSSFTTKTSTKSKTASNKSTTTTNTKNSTAKNKSQTLNQNEKDFIKRNIQVGL